MVKINKRNRLLKSEILRKKKDFEQVFASAKIISSPCFILRYLESPNRKVGFVVSRSITSKAVIRNRIKRYLRDIYRNNKNYFLENYTYLFQARELALTKTFYELKDEIINLCTQVSN